MSNNETSEMAEILHRVTSWPQPMRLALARQILQNLVRLTKGRVNYREVGPPPRSWPAQDY